MNAEEARRPDRRDSEQPHQAFGRVLEAARESYGLNRNQLANEAEVAYSMLFNVERGRRRASDAFIGKVAPHLGLRPDRMIKVRNALEIDRKFPLGRRSQVQSFMAGVGGQLEDRLRAHLGHDLTDLFADAQPIQTLAGSLADADMDIGDPQLEQLIRDIHGLTQDELGRVRGYVDRLIEDRPTPRPHAQGNVRKRPRPR